MGKRPRNINSQSHGGVHSLHNNCAVLLYTGIHSDGTGVKCGVRVMCG